LIIRRDLLLEAVPRDQAMDEDVFLLADAVGAVRGLVFHGWIEPEVVVDHPGGRGEVEPDASGLEADEEDGRALSRLEGLHCGVSLFLGEAAMEQEGRDAQVAREDPSRMASISRTG
jgi:hypothetical protein